MPRSIASKCSNCATLSAEQAQQIHGVEGDNCWEAERCKKRRSHYRHRGRRNATRRVSHQLQMKSPQPLVEKLSISTPAIASVVLIIYSEQPHTFKDDTPIHAIGAELWLGKQRHAELEPILCLGMRGDKVQALLPQILEAFSEQFSERHNKGHRFMRFSAKVHCHIKDCPGAHPFYTKRDLKNAPHPVEDDVARPTIAKNQLLSQ